MSTQNVIPRLIYSYEKYKSVFPFFKVSTDNHVYTVQLLDLAYLKPIKCVDYTSLSGLTFSYCLKVTKNGTKKVTGLFAVNTNYRTLELKSNRKLWRDVDSVNLEYVPSWARLIYIDNYGYEIYESVIRVPTVRLPTVYSDHGIEIVDFNEPYTVYKSYVKNAYLSQVNFKKQNVLNMYDTEITFGEPVEVGLATFSYDPLSNLAYLIVTNGETHVTINGEKTIPLHGAYLFLMRQQ